MVQGEDKVKGSAQANLERNRQRFERKNRPVPIGRRAPSHCRLCCGSGLAQPLSLKACSRLALAFVIGRKNEEKTQRASLTKGNIKKSDLGCLVADKLSFLSLDRNTKLWNCARDRRCCKSILNVQPPCTDRKCHAALKQWTPFQHRISTARIKHSVERCRRPMQGNQSWLALSAHAQKPLWTVTNRALPQASNHRVPAAWSAALSKTPRNFKAFFLECRERTNYQNSGRFN